MTEKFDYKKQSFANKLREAGLDDPEEPEDTIDWTGNVISKSQSWQSYCMWWHGCGVILITEIWGCLFILKLGLSHQGGEIKN